MQTFKFSLLALGVLLAATFTGCDSPITVGLLPAPDSSTIHVSGSGSVTGEPDLAMLRLGVSVERKSVAEAREEAASAMTTVLDSLTANGIVETDVQDAGIQHPSRIRLRLRPGSGADSAWVSGEQRCQRESAGFGDAQPGHR